MITRLGEPWDCLTSPNVRLEWHSHSSRLSGTRNSWLVISTYGDIRNQTLHGGRSDLEVFFIKLPNIRFKCNTPIRLSLNFALSLNSAFTRRLLYRRHSAKGGLNGSNFSWTISRNLLEFACIIESNITKINWWFKTSILCNFWLTTANN